MKLYTFHKLVRPFTNYLNIRHIPFKFVSINNRCHVFKLPRYMPTVYGYLDCSKRSLRLLVPHQLSFAVEGDSILIF